MTNEIMDILIDTVLVAMIIMFGTSFLFILRLVIEDINDSIKEEMENYEHIHKRDGRS